MVRVGHLCFSTEIVSPLASLGCSSRGLRLFGAVGILFCSCCPANEAFWCAWGPAWAIPPPCILQPLGASGSPGGLISPAFCGIPSWCHKMRTKWRKGELQSIEGFSPFFSGGLTPPFPSISSSQAGRFLGPGCLAGMSARNGNKMQARWRNSTCRRWQQSVITGKSRAKWSFLMRTDRLLPHWGGGPDTTSPTNSFITKALFGPQLPGGGGADFLRNFRHFRACDSIGVVEDTVNASKNGKQATRGFHSTAPHCGHFGVLLQQLSGQYLQRQKAFFWVSWPAVSEKQQRQLSSGIQGDKGQCPCHRGFLTATLLAGRRRCGASLDGERSQFPFVKAKNNLRTVGLSRRSRFPLGIDGGGTFLLPRTTKP